MSRIEDYALLGDLHTGALVGGDGSIDWLCLPNFDSPACFAALLDSERAGRWLLAAAGGGTCTRRRYRGDTLVLESEWQVRGGHVRVIDFMPPRGGASDLMRIVEGVSGSVTMQSELVLRFDYGRVVPWVRRVPGGIEAIAGPDAVWLRTPVPLEGREKSTVAEFTVRAGERIPFAMTWSPSYHRAPPRLDAEDALLETVRFWETWSARSHVNGRWREAIQRSLIVLKALTFAPTGGVVAAVTTSLPEQIGGPRNWDYRYCWLRDSTYTLQALLAAGYVEEAKAWRQQDGAPAGQPGGHGGGHRSRCGAGRPVPAPAGPQHRSQAQAPGGGQPGGGEHSVRGPEPARSLAGDRGGEVAGAGQRVVGAAWAAGEQAAVVEAMHGDLVSGVGQVPAEAGVARQVLAEHEERGPDAVVGQQGREPGSGQAVRAVVEGQRHMAGVVTEAGQAGGEALAQRRDGGHRGGGVRGQQPQPDGRRGAGQRGRPHRAARISVAGAGGAATRWRAGRSARGAAMAAMIRAGSGPRVSAAAAARWAGPRGPSSTSASTGPRWS